MMKWNCEMGGQKGNKDDFKIFEHQEVIINWEASEESVRWSEEIRSSLFFYLIEVELI